MNHRAKSLTPGLRPAFASPSQRSAARGLGPKSTSPDRAPLSLEAVLTETLRVIERLAAQARARIAARDGLSGQVAQKVSQVGAPAPLPSLTSTFATRREIFGAFDGEADHG